MEALYHLLVVDDDMRLRGLLERYLSDNGYMISTAQSAKEAREVLAKESIDLIILDIMMPHETGLEFMTSLQTHPNKALRHIPILLLTALDSPQDRLKGLEMGAQDYLTKPFEPKELLLRIQRILDTVGTSKEPFISLGDYRFYLTSKILKKAGNVVHLTYAEQQLLEIFAANPRAELSRDELAAKAGVPLSPRTIDVQITRLRRKLEKDPKQPIYLRTVRHKGYVLWPS